MSQVWILNPDAENELSRPGVVDYTSKRELSVRMAERRSLFAPLVLGEPAYFPHELEAGLGQGQRALCWSPTPSALRAARRAGFSPQAAPATEILRRVTSRAFLVECGLPGPAQRRFVQTRAELEQLLAQLTPGSALRCKRAFSFAGRGHLILRDALRAGDERYLEDSLRQGGFLVEPELQVEREWSLHGMLDPEGAVLLGAPCRLWVDENRHPLRVELAAPAAAAVAEAGLAELGHSAAAALATAGYFGAFGLDVLELGDGQLVASDLNARFTLGWSTGMADGRTAALALLGATES